MRYQFIPLLAVLVCGGVAWRIWREAPRITVVGQVNKETADARSPASGTLAEPTNGSAPQLYDAVTEGQVIARVEHEPGKWEQVKAPIAGQVTEVHRQPGQAITSGQTIYTIAANQGKRVTTYLRGDQWTTPETGVTVQVQPRSNPHHSYKAVVEHIGPQFQKIPEAQQRDRKTEEWGLPVVVRLLPHQRTEDEEEDPGLRPGELVIVSFKDMKAPKAATVPGPTSAKGTTGKSPA
jgi:pyruvate/2-oxoglutarate dehydrogenase complex dihydrolipoamide acyltransferase (E2) component